MKLIPADNAPGFARDAESGAIININKSEIQQAREAKRLRKQKEADLDRLRQDVDDIKIMLTQIAEKLNG